MSVHRLECESRSHIGLWRKTNQDYLECFPQEGVLLLADGMGGHRAGEVAARVAVRAAADLIAAIPGREPGDALQSTLLVGEALEGANRAVLAAGAENPDFAGMGTTLVAAVFRSGRVFFGHIGDSRLYRLRDGQLQCLTRDHSLMQDLLDQGVYANRAAAKAAGIGDHILTQSVGLRRDVEPDLGEDMLAPDDLYLVCSDGLCGRVSDHEIGHIMSSAETLCQMGDKLVDLALDAGGRDNISLIVARAASD